MSEVRVGLVIVSHSGNLAKGVVEVAGQMAPDIQILPAGGTDDDRIGTSYDRVHEMITRARAGGRSVLVLADLGSAAMVTEAVIEEFDDGVCFADVPVVEGAVAAAVAAQGGADLAGVAEAAATAIGQFTATGSATGSTAAVGTAVGAEVGTDAAPDSGGLSEVLTLKNKLGLHARPAAMVARIAAEYDAQVTINGTEATSVLALMGLALPGGAQVELRASGPQAEAVIKALVPHFEEGFGEE